MSGKKPTFLITSGATKEYIDPVRFIGNDSSGRMGAALARRALLKKCRVIFISGQSSFAPPKGVELIETVSAAEMFKAVKDNFAEADIIIGAAAVADFAPLSFRRRKVKKEKGIPVIRLKKNPDIIAYCGKNKKGRTVAGFALETENLAENALKKLKNKNLDLIIANGKDALGSQKSSVIIMGADGRAMEIRDSDKNKIAGKIINETIRIFTNNKAGQKGS